MPWYAGHAEPTPVKVGYRGLPSLDVERLEIIDILTVYACPTPGQFGSASFMVTTYGICSYAIVQSYIQSTLSYRPARQACRPRARGRREKFKASICRWAAHFLLMAAALLVKFVPSGKITSHIGIRFEVSARARILSAKRCWSVSQRRLRKIQEKNARPCPMMGTLRRSSLSTT